MRQTFVEEASSLLEACEEPLMSLEQADRRVEALADIFRVYHTVKGSSSCMLTALRQIRSDAESGPELRKSMQSTTMGSSSAKPANLAIKIDSARVNAVMDMVGELVVIKSQIEASLSRRSLDPRLRTLIAQLDKNVRELHERILSMHMISLRSMDERIADPLMHLCRNAVDHGIESSEKRKAANKCPEGTISLKAFRKGESVLIEVADDGHGIDRQAVIRRAIDRKLLDPDANTEVLTDHDIHNFLFSPGFSTADKVTDVSGRGVGLDVVKANIMAISGRIEIKSTPGLGTRLSTDADQGRPLCLYTFG
ncbi:chemotaxis protein CheA [Oligoflexus tunisiensis]|uniref:chemotaxis protein CheA n=1 Tax=Oligoflexus tunisiensis TaxID=708132 RepID=UPI001C40579B|nr:ATP-binding protein [Oligoflexus tunisiensis]